MEYIAEIILYFQSRRVIPPGFLRNDIAIFEPPHVIQPGIL